MNIDFDVTGCNFRHLFNGSLAFISLTLTWYSLLYLFLLRSPPVHH